MRKRLVAVLCTAVMAVGLLAGCGEKQTSTTPTTQPTTAATKTPDTGNTGDTTTTPAINGNDVDSTGLTFKEAPMLAEQVAAGTLPKVEDRLPVAEDVMVESMDSIGQYGGSIKMALTKAGWGTGKPIEEGLFRFKTDGTIEPNVAKGYDVNADATEYTIYLREGMRWSDGEPFTAEDCVFFYDHMCVPGTFGKSLWDCFKVANPNDPNEVTTAVFEKVDDYTFKVKFQYPKASFLENVAINAKWLYAPKHYHVNILPEFIGDDAAAAKATEMGFSDAKAMGKETGYYFWNVSGIPTLNPFVLSTEPGKNDVNGDYYEFVRNPYYWKVDAEGNQLPYIDKIEYTRISDASQSLLLTLNGSLTVADAGWPDMATLTENASVGNYHIVEWNNSSWGDLASQLQLNQTANDEDLRALFQNKDFRQALSICVDREQYSILVTDGWAEPNQCSPSKGMMGYSEEWSKKWTEYDVAKAKSLLEGCGLVMGSDGYYDFANGKDFVLNINTFTDSGADTAAQVLMKYFGEAGIKTTYKPVDKDLLNNYLTTNDFDCILGPVAPAETVSIILRPDTLVPVRNYAAWYGQVGNWYASQGAEGVAPTGDLLELCNLYDELKSTIDESKRIEIAEKMLKLHEENVWIIGYAAATTTLFAVDNNLRNFTEDGIMCDEFRGLGLAHCQTWYFAE